MFAKFVVRPKNCFKWMAALSAPLSAVSFARSNMCVALSVCHVAIVFVVAATRTPNEKCVRYFEFDATIMCTVAECVRASLGARSRIRLCLSRVAVEAATHFGRNPSVYKCGSSSSVLRAIFFVHALCWPIFCPPFCVCFVMHCGNSAASCLCDTHK